MTQTEAVLLESPRLRTLQGELAAGIGGAEETFWNAVVTEGTPMVEPVDGTEAELWVTFLWRETRDEPIDHVSLAEWFSPGDRGTLPLTPLGESSVWFRTYRMVRGLRSEYAFLLNDSIGPSLSSEDVRERMKRLRLDPLNPNSTVEPWMTLPEDRWLDNSSVFELPGSEPFRWKVWRDAARGTVTEQSFRSELLDNERVVWTYEPPAGSEAVGEPMLLIQFDGDACVGLMGLPVVLDNLHASGQVRPIVGVFVGNVDRGEELPCNTRFADFVADELIPWARERFGIPTGAEYVIAAGQSYGGLAAAWVGLTRSDAVGHVISQSGSYWWMPNPETLWGAPSPIGDAPACGWLPTQVASWDTVTTRFTLEAGVMEAHAAGVRPSLVASNRHMRDVLIAKGHEVEYREFPGGHEWWYWGELTADGLLRHAAAGS